MAVTVGTDVFISVADADTYHSLIGNTAWALLSTGDKEIGLRVGASYIERVFWDLLQISSTKTVSTQALLFPRDGLLDWEGNEFDSATIPDGAANANAEWALISNTEDLDPTIPAGGQLKSKKIGPIEKEWWGGSIPNKIHQLPNSLMEPFLESSSQGTVKLLRA